MDPAAPLGERIAFHRRRRGLSQVKLAQRLGRSESWLSQIERGVRPLDRMSVLNQVARALSVPVSELAPASFGTVDEPQEHEAVSACRVALTRYPALRADRPPAHAPDIDLLDDDAAEAWPLVHAAAYTQLVTLLPRVLADARALIDQPPRKTARRARRVEAETYQAMSAMLMKLGETDMAWLAADRAVHAAERVPDPLLIAAGVVRIGHAFLAADRLDDAARVATTAAGDLETQTTDGSPQALSAYGALLLVAAVAATRQGRVDDAHEHLAAAEATAARLGEDRNDFHTEFGPTNVAVHAVSIAVESGDAGAALRRAAKIDAGQLSPERRARLLIDVARAYGQRRMTDEAVRTLREAEKLTPEQVRTHQLVREMVRDLLRSGRRQPDKALRALARRIGVIP